MKIYKVYTESNHKITYVLGYFLKRESAEKCLEEFGKTRPYTASSPLRGIDEIEVIEE